ncbi:phage Gp37/Gp68 family protein [Brevundimonas naejangsanensis]|nr:phage Gp37/Gp68 family protein [Brevundimonas naejangsanensis]
MADKTHIEWTDATWNVVTGCAIVSPGCTNCYAMKLAGTRLRDHPSRNGLTTDSKAGPVWNGQVRFNTGWLTQPLRWTKPRKVFVCAHGDLFHEGVTDDQLDQIFAVMALAPQHVFQVLTKRPKRMHDYLLAFTAERLSKALRAFVHAGEKATQADRFIPLPLPNVWMGVSAEDQTRANERIPVLLETPAAIRWVSAEPLIGPLDLTAIDDGFSDPRNVLRSFSAQLQAAQYTESIDLCIDTPGLDWVVVGGESGAGSRPMHPGWARDLRDQCADAGVPFLFKQWGDWTPGENAQNTIGRTVETADWFNDAWNYQTLTPASAEGMYIDDEPTLYRAGKRAAGRLLDGQLHDGYPA